MSDPRVAIITGASRGIGAATARLLSAKNHSVVLVARSQEPLAELAAEITSQGGDALSLPGDIADLSFCEQVVHKTRTGRRAGEQRSMAGNRLDASDYARIVGPNVADLPDLTRLSDSMGRRGHAAPRAGCDCQRVEPCFSPGRL